MRSNKGNWTVHNKNRFLQVLMTRLAGKALIAFEGGASIQGLNKIEGASEQETDRLRRHTTWPSQNFVIVPLEEQNLKPIWRALGGTLGGDVLHVQIEKDGSIAFGAYDNFGAGSIVFGSSISREILDDLIGDGFLSRSS